MKKYICLGILLAFTLSCLGGCKASESMNTDKKEESKEEQITSSEPVDEISTPKMDMENPISELYSLDFEDDSVPPTPISYHVPQINCDTEDAKKINDEIKEKYGSEVEEGLQNKEEGYTVVCYSIKWELIISGEYTFALVVSSEFPGSNINYDVYNFDGMTGKSISNEEILGRVNLEDAEFVAMVKEKAANRYAEKYNNVKDMMPELYLEQLEYTVSNERININMPMFVSEDGGLSVIADIGSLAGAGSYYEVLKIK